LTSPGRRYSNPPSRQGGSAPQVFELEVWGRLRWASKFSPQAAHDKSSWSSAAFWETDHGADRRGQHSDQ
jgi:anti-sigma-K factor RskA